MRKTRFRISMLGLILWMASVTAQAAVITLDVVAANWTNVVGGGGTVTFANTDGQVGNEEIRWGSGGTIKSGYRFDGNAPPALSVSIATQFKLGDFTHFNFPIQAGTSITSARLDILADLTVDGTSISEGPFLFSFLHNETTNGCTPLPGCANDLVTVSNLVSSDTFTIGGVVYTLGINGFSTDGGATISNTFSTAEGAVNTAGMYAVINTPSAIPEPATLGLLGLGLLGLSATRRRMTA